jgi:c-di-GMP-binding flagellar brake protein YcgR
MVDRRRYPRFEFKVNATYAPATSEDVNKLGRTQNVSAEGICFESEKKFNKGDCVSLKVDLGDKMPPVTLMGQIRWSQELKTEGSGEKKYMNGVKLLDIQDSDEGRFLKYYCDRMVEKLSQYLKI